MLLNGEEHLLRTCSSVLGNVMTWDLTVPSDYQINIDWYIIKEVLWHLSLGIFTWKDISIMKICRKITHSWLATSSSGQSIKIFTPLIPCPWFIYKIIISKLTFNSKWLYCGEGQSTIANHQNNILPLISFLPDTWAKSRGSSSVSNCSTLMRGTDSTSAAAGSSFPSSDPAASVRSSSFSCKVWPHQEDLTYWGPQKMADIFLTAILIYTKKK